MTASIAALPCGGLAAFQARSEAWRAALGPQSDVEQSLVEQAVQSSWQDDRIIRIQNALADRRIHDGGAGEAARGSSFSRPYAFRSMPESTSSSPALKSDPRSTSGVPPGAAGTRGRIHQGGRRGTSSRRPTTVDPPRRSGLVKPLQVAGTCSAVSTPREHAVANNRSLLRRRSALRRGGSCAGCLLLAWRCLSFAPIP